MPFGDHIRRLGATGPARPAGNKRQGNDPHPQQCGSALVQALHSQESAHPGDAAHRGARPDSPGHHHLAVLRPPLRNDDQTAGPGRRRRGRRLGRDHGAAAAGRRQLGDLRLGTPPPGDLPAPGAGRRHRPAARVLLPQRGAGEAGDRPVTPPGVPLHRRYERA